MRAICWTLCMQNVEVDLILADLESLKVFSVLKGLDMCIANTSTSNNGTVHKKGIMNIREEKSSSEKIRISGKAIKNRDLCSTPAFFAVTQVKKR